VSAHTPGAEYFVVSPKALAWQAFEDAQRKACGEPSTSTLLAFSRGWDAGAEHSSKDLLAALEGMLRVQDALMPGLRHIAVQDYALINDAPIAARAAIANARGQA